MLFKITNGSVSFGADTVLEQIDFEIDAHQRIAVVGRNGCGKSTLLKCISGEIVPEEGMGEERFSVMRPGNRSVGCLKQIAFEDESISMLDEILKAYSELLKMAEEKERLSSLLNSNQSDELIAEYTQLEERFVLAGGYYFRKEYEAAIKSFGFTEEDKAKPLSAFSGGQRTKIAFLRLLLEKPDILLLDEPTNHLDVNAVLWLENYLNSYKNSVVVVSHDRMFLDRIADVVYEIEYGVTKRYKGNYSSFLEQKRVNYEKTKKDFEAQQKEIARLERIVERFKNKPTKVAMTRSKLKQIEHMVKIEAPNKYDLTTFHANCQPKEKSVEQVLTIKNLAVGYDRLLATVNLELKRGEKLGIIGGNGLGKSTFIKTLVGKTPSLCGEYKFGLKTQIGYFDQQMAQYSSEKSVYDDFYDTFPSLNRTQIRSALGAFQFSGEEVEKCVNSLSGGERVRLALCKIFMERPNVLIFDEPTNHMDIVGKDTLERMLSEYEGTLIFVSHDRYFVNRLADKLLVFENDEARFYPYGYSEYLEKNIAVNYNNDAGDEILVSTPVKQKQGNIIRERKKQEEKNKRRKLKLEELISNCESEISKLQERLTDESIASDFAELERITLETNELENKLLEYLEEWDSLEEIVCEN